MALNLPAQVASCNVGRELVDVSNDAPGQRQAIRTWVQGRYVLSARIHDGRKFNAAGANLDELLDDLRRFARRRPTTANR